MRIRVGTPRLYKPGRARETRCAAARGPRLITGSNTNVRYQGRIYHVQTEDSGRANPHIITHVYFGGTILASEKSEYGDLLEREDVTEAVKERIEKQHKAMVARLKKGEFDRAIAERLGDGASAATDPSTEPPETAPQLDDVPPPAADGKEGAAHPAAADGDAQRAFGDGIVSQKPLDEVILDYLVQKARDRGGKKRDARAKE